MRDWILCRVTELSATSYTVSGFAQDMLGHLQVFQWHPERRELIRGEIDALCFVVYGLARDDVEYILDSLEMIRSRENRELGHYRTKLLVLKAYDRMQLAIETGEPYQSLLDPPPADPRVAHPIPDNDESTP